MTYEALSATMMAVLFGMVLVWFALLKRLYTRLEDRHPDKYESMGRPTLFLRNNMATGWLTMKFIVGRQHRSLNDAYVSKLSDFMLAFFVIFSMLFLGRVLVDARATMERQGQAKPASASRTVQAPAQAA